MGRATGSVRNAGLNGAGAALVGDAAAIFGNPAGLATIRHVAVEGSYHTESTGGRMLTGAGAWRLRQFDAGAGLQYFSLQGAPATREILTATTLVYRFGLIAAGATTKWVSSNLSGPDQHAFGTDLGIAIAVFDLMAIGFSMQNVGGNWTDQSILRLPRLSRLGFTMNYVDPQESFRLISVIEVQWPEERGARVILGGEAGTVIRGVGVIGRLAYGSRWPGYQPSSVTYGGSVVISRLVIDYALEPSALGSARHRVGMRMTL